MSDASPTSRSSTSRNILLGDKRSTRSKLMGLVKDRTNAYLKLTTRSPKTTAADKCALPQIDEDEQTDELKRQLSHQVNRHTHI